MDVGDGGNGEAVGDAEDNMKKLMNTKKIKLNATKHEGNGETVGQL